MQGQITFVNFGVGFVEQVDPDLVQRARSELWLSERLAWDQVVNSDRLPFAVLAQPQSVYAQWVYLCVVEEQSFDKRVMLESQAHQHRVKCVVR